MIEIDAKELKKVEKLLKDHAAKAPAVIANTLNKSATYQKKKATEYLKANYALNEGKAGKVTKTFGPPQRASASNLRNISVVRDGSIPLNYFNYSPTEPQYGPVKGKLNISVKKRSSKESYRIFAANVSGVKLWLTGANSKHVWTAGKKGPKADPEVKRGTQLPINKLFGPPVPEILDNEQLRDEVNKAVAVFYEEELERQIKKVLEPKK